MATETELICRNSCVPITTCIKFELKPTKIRQKIRIQVWDIVQNCGSQTTDSFGLLSMILLSSPVQHLDFIKQIREYLSSFAEVEKHFEYFWYLIIISQM